MHTKFKNTLFYLINLLYITSGANLHGAVNLPARPDSHVVDLANVIDSSTKYNLEKYLIELERKTTAQIVVLTIKSLEGEPLEDLSLKVAHDKWKLGQKGKDNGILLLIALKERKYRIEVGYGLEGVIPDSLAGSIGRDYLVPFFRQGNYSKGAYTATLALISEVAKDAGVEITGMPQYRKQVRRTIQHQPPSFLNKIIGGIFLLFMLILFIKNPRLFLMLLLFSSMGGGRGSYSGGGGFGGFSGGGGGFGGGGASGGW
jgi:uncharacterized protein